MNSLLLKCPPEPAFVGETVSVLAAAFDFVLVPPPDADALAAFLLARLAALASLAAWRLSYKNRFSFSSPFLFC
jgi:hypothetical protein